MSELDQLLDAVPNTSVKRELEKLFANLSQPQKFGLIFEDHAPESVALSGLIPKVGDSVQRRDIVPSDGYWKVHKIDSGTKRATIISQDTKKTQATVDVSDLLVVKHFGDPVYTTLKPLGRVERAKNKSSHAVINGENFHALQLLCFQFQGQVDCIYIDPPYNTGARDWKYNNRYVDGKDTWRHSKWLSFMEKRLRLARKLLKPDGVLVVTIDANEVHHLGVLLESLFPDALRQMVTIVMNPSGASGDGFSRVEEFAFFCFLGGTLPSRLPDDFLTGAEGEEREIAWESLLRRGNTWYRAARRNLCYPVLIDPKTKRIVDVGEPFDGNSEKIRPLSDEKKRARTIKGLFAAWPVRTDGKLGIWRVEGPKLKELASKGYAYATSYDEARETWSIKYLMSGTVQAIDAGEIEKIGTGENGEAILKANTAIKTMPKTVWYRGRHTAGGSGGTQLLTDLLGEKGKFPYPKSLYAVMDTIKAAIGHRKDALIMDFFAGSGTTLHATCALNAEDGGTRRCILVTNNEVNEKIAADLARKGDLPGDPEFEQHGIFEAVTRPRCEAAITGKRPDGKPVSGNMLDDQGESNGRSLSEGFQENADFFKLEYLDPNRVDLGKAFKAILPAIWLASGGVGKWEVPGKEDTFSIPEKSSYAVLFKEAHFRKFQDALKKRSDINAIWLITDSEEAFAEMRSELLKSLGGRDKRITMLYRDYLKNFEINTAKNL